MNITLGAQIGQGNTADVFDIGGNRVVKLFHSGYPHRYAEAEFRKANLLNGLDLPIPQTYGMVSVDNRDGIVYDKISGQSLLDIVMQTYDIRTYAPLLASAHKRMISRELPSAVSCKAVLKSGIENAKDISVAGKTQALELLHKLPEGIGLCHGDFHFGNVLMDGTKLYVIDFMNICKGPREFDIARTLYLTELTPVPENIPDSDKDKIRELKHRSMDIYLREIGTSREALSDWLTVIAAARLSELGNRQTEERNTVLRYLDAHGISVFPAGTQEF